METLAKQAKTHYNESVCGAAGPVHVMQPNVFRERELNLMSTLGKKTVEDLNVKGRNVLVRCDFNVPMKDGVITNDNRIVAALPTIKKLIENGGRLVLCSHLGKPKNGPEEKFSLAPVAVRLSELLGKPVVFANDGEVTGPNAKAAVAAMQDGDVVLLQNTRFRKEETKNLPEFSKDLAELVGPNAAYVNDAFGSAHRAHCSTAGVTDYIKDTAVGYLMEKEIRYLGNAVNDPERPFVAILGGAKVAAGMGACALTAATEDEALLKAKQVLALLPSSNLEDSEIIDSDDMSRLISAIDAADVDALVAALMDGGASIELYAAYEPSVRVFMGRMGGHSVGVVAASGKLTAGALQKAARFVRFMDCFGIAVISLLNTCGVTVDSVNAQGWLFKAQSQLLFAYAEATAPKLAVVTGDAIGQAYVAMGGKANADITYAWPGAVISALTPEAAVAVLYADQVKADKDLSVEEARAKYAGEYVEKVAGAVNAAKDGMVDDIIDPAKTRAMLISALEMLGSKRDSNPPKKHDNLPM